MELHSMSIYKNHKLTFTTLQNDELQFFQKFGKNIKELRINGDCLVDNYFLMDILKCLPLLEQLEFSNLDTSHFFKFKNNQVPVILKNLKCIRFFYTTNYGQYMTRNIEIMMPNLKDFIIKQNFCSRSNRIN